MHQSEQAALTELSNHTTCRRGTKKWNKGVIILLPKKCCLSDCKWRVRTPLCTRLGFLQHATEQTEGSCGSKTARRTSSLQKWKILYRSSIDSAVRKIIEQNRKWQKPVYINFTAILYTTGICSSLPGIVSKHQMLCQGLVTYLTSWEFLTGVRQGCILTAFLFFYRYWLSNEENNWMAVLWYTRGSKKLRDLDFADDIALISAW